MKVNLAGEVTGDKTNTFELLGIFMGDEQRFICIFRECTSIRAGLGIHTTGVLENGFCELRFNLGYFLAANIKNVNEF